MIPIRPAPEPDSFEARVRRPGLAALAELVGESPGLKRRGSRRKAVYARREDIKWDQHESLSYWTRALDDLRDAYHNLCSYLAMEIPHAVGWAATTASAPDA